MLNVKSYCIKQVSKTNEIRNSEEKHIMQFFNVITDFRAAATLSALNHKCNLEFLFYFLQLARPDESLVLVSYLGLFGWLLDV